MEVYVTIAVLTFCKPLILSLCLCPFHSFLFVPLLPSSSQTLPALFCLLYFFFTAALAPLSLYLMPPFPPSPPSLSLPCSLSSFSLSAVQHSDYHSSHRVRPDSQILLSTILHHLLLGGAMERERERDRQRKERREGGWTAE